jgi:hypothetical protein
VKSEYLERHTSSTVEEEDEVEESAYYVLWIQRTDVPRRAIRFFKRPHYTGLHLVTAFRLYISITDVLFPNQWKICEENADPLAATLRPPLQV